VEAEQESKEKGTKMSTISAADVKALRTQTGAGMMDCKRALSDAEGDSERAVELLRERGLAKAGKRAGRETTEGAIGLSMNGGVGAIVELACETDFVARTDEYQGLVQEIADLVAADASLTDAGKTLAASMGSDTVEARIHSAISKLGENVALKRVARVAVEPGVSGGYVHAGGKLAVIVGVAASSQDARIKALAKDVAMHVAAADPTPLAVDSDGVPAETVEAERRVLTAQAEQSGKPENVIEKMVEGRMRKFFAENCLLQQAFVKDPDQSVGDIVAAVAKDVGAELKIAEFSRFRLGEESTG
jgi:elongation factor Ts